MIIHDHIWKNLINSYPIPEKSHSCSEFHNIVIGCISEICGHCWLLLMIIGLLADAGRKKQKIPSCPHDILHGHGLLLMWTWSAYRGWSDANGCSSVKSTAKLKVKRPCGVFQSHVPPNHPSHSTILILKPMVFQWGPPIKKETPMAPSSSRMEHLRSSLAACCHCSALLHTLITSTLQISRRRTHCDSWDRDHQRSTATK
jgi:hypothetical protein